MRHFMKFQIASISFALLLACSSVDKNSLTETSAISGKYDCEIKNVFTLNNDVFIVVDIIDFLTGEEAVQVAKSYGEAEFDINENGDTNFYVFNDYYILNTEVKTDTLLISKNANISLIKFTSDGKPIKADKKTDLIGKNSHNYPCSIEISNGIITRLDEHYIP